MHAAPDSPPSWMTKPTDRFVLRWIKVHLSAPVSRRVAVVRWVRPWMVTVTAAGLGVSAGVSYGAGAPVVAAGLGAVGQILDGVDGQVSRITGRESSAGALLDSVLDRYADGAMVLGSVVYLQRSHPRWPRGLLWLLGGLALLGSNAVSYSAARAESLGFDGFPPTRASKGTRSAVNIVAAAATPVWSGSPLLSLLYLATHPNSTVVARLLRVARTQTAFMTPSGVPPATPPQTSPTAVR